VSKKSKKRKNGQKAPQQPQRNLLPWLLGSGLVVLIAIAIAMLAKQPTPDQATTPAKVTGSPRLEADKDRIDFGDVPLGKTVKASFKLTNVGDESLTISYPPVAEVVDGC
jgi:hypothetical protein